MKNRNHQFLIQVGSLTTNLKEQSFRLTRGDKVVGGKLRKPLWFVVDACAEAFESGRRTLSQPKQRGKDIDRRITNCAGIVKVTRGRSWSPGTSKRRSIVRLEKPEISEEVMGKSTQGTYRCKSRRYVWKDIFLGTGETLTGSVKDKGRYKVVDPRKVSFMSVSESVMVIVAIILGVSKAFRSEGPLVFSGFTEGWGV